MHFALSTYCTLCVGYFIYDSSANIKQPFGEWVENNLDYLYLNELRK